MSEDTPQNSYDYFMWFENWDKNIKDSILWFDINGKKIEQLVTISWYPKEEWFNSLWKVDFQKWITWIFKDDEIESNQYLLEKLGNKITYYSQIKQKNINNLNNITTNKTIDILLNDLENHLINNLKKQKKYDDIIEYITLPSIREQIENILVKQIGSELTETSASLLWDKKVLNNVFKDLNNVNWELLWEWIEEKMTNFTGELIKKLEIEYMDKLLVNHRNQLEKSWVLDMKSLLVFWVSNYNNHFFISFIEKIIWKSAKLIALNDLKNLWNIIFCHYKLINSHV